LVIAVPTSEFEISFMGRAFDGLGQRGQASEIIVGDYMYLVADIPFVGR
jgi:hypothetical protein